MADVISLFVQVCEIALPIAVVFALGGRLCRAFLGMAFDGRINL